MLNRSFSESPAEPLSLVQADNAVAWATKCSLAGRLYSRTPRATLLNDLGPAAFEVLAGRYRREAVAALRLEASVRALGAAARTLDVPVVLLKGAALHCLRLVSLGGRSCADLDVLVPEDRAEELWTYLRRSGWVSTPAHTPPGHYHLPPLARSGELGVEIHRWISGVSFGQTLRTSFADLLESKRLIPCPVAGEGVFSPISEVLFAHALVHGFAQNWDPPTRGRPFQALADLVDLAGNTEGGRSDVVVSGMAGARAVPEQRAQAVLDLAHLLGQGLLVDGGKDDTPARRMLAFLVELGGSRDFGCVVKYHFFARHILSRGPRGVFRQWDTPAAWLTRRTGSASSAQRDAPNQLPSLWERGERIVRAVARFCLAWLRVFLRNPKVLFMRSDW